MHALSTLDDPRLVETMVKWSYEQKGKGRIRNIGFSYHGTSGDFSKILGFCDWDFVQIQFNYMNVNYQAGEEGLKLAASKGLAVFIMEPLLGGTLATSLPRDVAVAFKAAFPEQTPAQCGLRWLFNYKEITMVLSGMTTPEMVFENAASVIAPSVLSVKDLSVYTKVEARIRQLNKVLCGACRYCMPCPRGIDIPGCFAAYNISYSLGLKQGRDMYLHARAGCHPERCVKCGKCEKACPQGIHIIDELVKVDKRMLDTQGRIRRYIMEKDPRLYRIIKKALPQNITNKLKRVVRKFAGRRSI